MNWKTTPASRSRTLRDILLIARPPLLAVMQGGECARPKRLDIFQRCSQKGGPIESYTRRHVDSKHGDYGGSASRSQRRNGAGPTPGTIWCRLPSSGNDY